MTKCKWCGNEFKKRHNRQMYCSEECRRYARLEQNAEWMRNYRREYSQIKTIGSGMLGKHPRKVFLDEHITIRREMRRLRFKPAFQY